MGWTSTLEDMIERLNDAIHLLSESNNATNTEYELARESVQTMIYRAHCLAHELKKLLSIATDPAIDLAQALSDANHKVEGLQSELQNLRRLCKSAIAQRKDALDRADYCAEDARIAKRELRRLESVLEGVMKSAPASVYDAFPPKGRPRS